MPIDKVCQHCGGDYKVPPVRQLTSKYCSRACSDAAQIGEQKEIQCAECSTVFAATKDHGKWPKYCSRACSEAKDLKPEPKECLSCGAVFMAGRTSTGQSEDGRRKYCSAKCRQQGLKNGEERNCLNCQRPFYLNIAKQKQRNEECCCSTECQRQYYVKSLNPNWQGGYAAADGRQFVNLDRPGYVTKYMPRHRLAASEAMGRPVNRGEVVLVINNDKSDLRPENLFLCASASEFAKRFNGSLPWPTQSNLKKEAESVSAKNASPIENIGNSEK